MTDPMDDLKAALRAAPPAPDGAKRAADLAAAQAAFETFSQGTAQAARPSGRAPGKVGLREGAISMWTKLTSRGSLAATSGLVAAGLALVVFLPRMAGDVGLETALPPVTETAPLDRSQTDQLLAADEAVMDQAEALSDADLAAVAPPPAPAESPSVDAELARPAPTLERAESPRSAAKTAPRRTVTAANGATAAQKGAAKRMSTGVFRGGGVPQSAPDIAPRPLPNTESFPEAETNPLKITAEDPVSTFSIDVDTASYSIVRNALNRGQLPPRGAVRAEEMINYFPYAYAGPEGDQPFATQVTVTQTPWNAGTQLVHIGLQGRMPAVEDRPPLNLVFLIDSSGSMQNANKLPLLKQSLRLMLPQLRAEDQVAIVTYAGNAGQVLAPTSASDRAAIFAALDRIDAGGSTAGQAGLQQAYAVAEGMAAEGEVSRVILATDGDFNVGLSDPAALKDFIATKRESGTYLSVLGFGRGNLDDATMQALAQNGNGQAAYIDTLSEARKVLVDQLSGALFPIANDVKIQVEFNPATVAEYRLIGYETRALRREDFNNDRVDAGEIGAGHRVTAIYEVTPVGSPAVRVDPLRYGGGDTARPAGGALDELGFLRLRYKQPGAADSVLLETPIGVEVASANSEVRFATAIAGFAQLLMDETALGDWGYDAAIALAVAARGEDAFGYRAEAIQLMRLAQSLQASRPAPTAPEQ